MNISTIFATLVLLAAPLKADSLEDLRAYLKAHNAQSPIRLKVTGEFRQAEGRRKEAAVDLPVLPVHLTIMDGASGFQILWDPAVLADAPESSHAEDLWLTLPNLAHASTTWLDPICLYRAANPARSLRRLLAVASLEERREEVWNGEPAQRLTFRFKSLLPERFRHRTYFPTGALTLWVAANGAPLASEVSSRYQVGLGLFFGEFSRKTTQKTTYRSVNDRIISATQILEDEAVVEREVTRTVLNLTIQEEKP